MTMKPTALPTYPFALAPLPFAYDELEPHIDTATMQIHHDKHHQAYITNLNAAIEGYPELHELSIEDLLLNKAVPESIRQTVHDQGGGHLNHQLFWNILTPGMTGARPAGALALAIERDFGSFDAFKARFVDIAAKHFASGWVFLAVDLDDGKLEVLARPDHDSVLPDNKTALLINDLWEHAYYLQYQNSRIDYLNAFWNVVNWKYVSERLEVALSEVEQTSPTEKSRKRA